MTKMIFVSLPVTDLKASIAFYQALGFGQNPQFSDATAACMVWSERPARARASVGWLGVDVVGGIPHFERTSEHGAASVKLLCEIAEKRGKLVCR